MGEIQKLENESGIETKEIDLEALLNKIANAAGSALSIDEFERNQKIMTDAGKKMTSGVKLHQEEINFLAKKDWQNEVYLHNFKIMREVFVKLGMTEEQIKYFEEHEGAHFEEAKKLGLNPEIIIKFYKLKNGQIKFKTAIKIGFKEGISSTSESLKSIAKAPKEPSPHDKKMVD